MTLKLTSLSTLYHILLNKIKYTGKFDLCYTRVMADKSLEPKQESDCPPSMKWVRGVLLLQEKWTLFIVSSLMEGPLGFNELSRRARGVNTTTLSQRMDLLEKEGIVTKTVYSTIPPRTSYELTPAGKGLRKVNEAIAQWSEEYLTDTSDVPPCDEE
jgi:DNA-binding HxlR family transcriptional regulator